MAHATITLELFKSGIHITCKELERLDEFIPRGDGDKLLKIINTIDSVCDHEARFSLTDKGKKLTE